MKTSKTLQMFMFTALAVLLNLGFASQAFAQQQG